MIEELKKIGLSENEARVYLALNHLGKAKAADVIQETRLHRNLVYQALETLVDRRLATKTTMGGVFRFQTTDPEHLRDPIREQETAVARVVDTLNAQKRLTDQEITVYEGEDAIRSFSLKSAASLESGETIHVLDSGGHAFEEALGERALKTYFADIQKKRGSIRILQSERRTYRAEILAQLHTAPWAEIHPLPYDFSPATTVVFTHHSVAFLTFETPQSVIEIRNPHLVNAYQKYFSFLWERKVRVEYGIDALHDTFYGMVDALRPGESYAVLGGNVGKEYTRLASFFDDFHHYRIQKGVVANILAFHNAAPSIRERSRNQGDPNDRVSKVKAFQTPFMSSMQVNLCQGKATMILYKNEPTIIHFDDPEVYEGFKIYFDEIWNRTTETLTGHEGIKMLCERVLEEGEDMYLIAATNTIMSTHREYYAAFTQRRVAKKMHLHLLANEATRGGSITTNPLADIAYLPPAFASPMVIWIFGDHVAHVLWHKPEMIFLIHDKKTAEYYRKYYEALKRIATP